METTNVTMTTTYVAVVDNQDFAIQNIAQPLIEFVFSDAAPSADLKGHVISEKDGAISGWGVGKIWARSRKEGSILAVTK